MAATDISKDSSGGNSGDSSDSRGDSFPIAILARTPSRPQTLEDTLLLAGLFNSAEAESRLDALRQAKENQTNAITARNEELKKNLEQLDSLRLKKQGFWATGEALATKLLAKRLDYPQRWFRTGIEEHQKLSEDVGNTIRSGLQLRLGLEREYFNQTEHDKELAPLEERRTKAQERYQKLEKYIDFLQRFGITKTTAGFMAWGGYLSFLAFGWFFGEIVRQLHNSKEGGFLQGILTSVNGIFELLGPVQGSLALFVFPLLILSFLGLIFYLVDLFLSRFDSSWAYEHRRSRRKPGDGTLWALLSDSGWAWLNNPARNIDRSYYTQLLAKLPVIYLWIAIPLLLAVLFSLGEFSQQLGDQGLYTYFGIVLCVVMSGFVLLYSTKVIEPRHRRYYEEEKSGFLNAVRANPELFFVLSVFLVLIVFSDVMPIFPAPWSARVTAPILLLILVSSFVVSYGLIYKGVFKDYDALKRELQELEERIKRHVGLPIIEIIDEELDRYQSELRKLQLDRARNVRRLFGSLRYYRWVWSDLWRAYFGRRHVRRIEFVRISPNDEILEPELVAEIDKTVRELYVTEEEITNFAESNREKQQKLDQLKSQENEYAELIVRGDTAYRMGMFLRTTLSARRRETHRNPPQMAEEPRVITAEMADSAPATEKGDGGSAEGFKKELEEISSLIRDNNKKAEGWFEALKDRIEKGESFDEAKLKRLVEMIKSG